jgi:hypothetical protein
VADDGREDHAPCGRDPDVGTTAAAGDLRCRSEGEAVGEMLEELGVSNRSAPRGPVGEGRGVLVHQCVGAGHGLAVQHKCAEL